MSKADFKFIGHATNTNTSYGIERIMYLVGKTNGLDSTNNGGYAAVGSAGQHASLSNSLSNSGTYYRAWNFADDTQGTNVHSQWTGLGFLATSSLGYLLNPASGSLWSAQNRTNGRPTRAAISLRAHLRLESASGNASGDTEVGAEIGVFFGNYMYSQTENYTVNNNGNVGGKHLAYNDTTTGGPFMPGYRLSLSSLKHRSNEDGNITDSNFGQEGVRLLLKQGPYYDYFGYNVNATQNPSYGQMQRTVPGTYALNNWYRVRLDITIMPGTHKLEVYTATASDTIGSETWTKRLTDYVYHTQVQFVRTEGANNSAYAHAKKGIGYYVHGRAKSAVGDQPRHSAFMDNFAVLQEKLEDSQPNN